MISPTTDNDRSRVDPELVAWPTDPALTRRVQLHHSLVRRRRISDALDNLLGLPDRYSPERYGRGQVAA